MTKKTDNTLAATLDTARHLAIADAITSSSLQHYPQGWILVIDTRAGTRYFVQTERKKPRFFKTIDAGAKAALSIGQKHITVLFENWQPNQNALDI